MAFHFEKLLVYQRALDFADDGGPGRRETRRPDGSGKRWAAMGTRAASPREYRIKKFGSWERSQEFDARVVAVGKEDGIDFALDRIVAKAAGVFSCPECQQVVRLLSEIRHFQFVCSDRWQRSASNLPSLEMRIIAYL